MDPDLNKLRHFLAVAEERNFTRAAARLGLSQQALSTSVGRLEGELGVALLERRARRVELTAAGRSLLETGPPLLSAWQATRDRAARAGHGEGGLVQIGRTPWVSGEDVAAVLLPIQARHPELRFAVGVALPDEMPGKVLSGAFRFAFSRVLEQPEGLALKVLGRQRVRVAIAAEHPLAGRRLLHLEELAGDTLVVRRVGSAGMHLMVKACRQAGFEPNVMVDPIEGLPPGSAVSAPDRFAFLVAPVGPLAAPPGGGVVVDFEPALEVPLQLAWIEGEEPSLLADIEAQALMIAAGDPAG